MSRTALFLFSILLSVACTDDSDYTIGVWDERSTFDGKSRSNAAAFTIGSKGYICTGYTGKQRLNDLWVYDIDGNYWTQLADMPDEAGTRMSAVGFTIGSKGYVTTGYDQSKYLDDTWEYNPAANTWTRKDDFAGEARHYAVGFGIGQYGYVGTGDSGDNFLKDFFRFDPDAPAGSQWEIHYGFGGNKRRGATVFIIDEVAYLCTGINNNSYVYDFWKFDPTATPQWEQLRDTANTDDDEDYDDEYEAIRRAYAVSFVIDGRGFLTTGKGSGGLKRDYWIYDPITDLWDNEDLTPFEGSSREFAVSFSTETRGFVITGTSDSYRFDDTWELLPYEIEE